MMVCILGTKIAAMRTPPTARTDTATLGKKDCPFCEFKVHRLPLKVKRKGRTNYFNFHGLPLKVQRIAEVLVSTNFSLLPRIVKRSRGEVVDGRPGRENGDNEYGRYGDPTTF